MTEILLCDIYSVSFKWQPWHLSFTHTTLFILLPCGYLDIWLRWLKGQREDNVSLPRRALLLYAGMAGVAHSRRWDETMLPPSCHVSAATAGIPHVSSFSVRCWCAAHIWVKNCKELLPSSYNNARFDQPLQATDWLRNFRTTNESFLSKVAIVFALGGCLFWLCEKKSHLFPILCVIRT